MTAFLPTGLASVTETPFQKGISMFYSASIDFSTLRGMTLTKIENRGDKLIFTTEDGRRFQMYHQQECCEMVEIEDIVGDLNDLIGSEVLRAEERSESGAEGYSTYTWTFYEIATIKGSVTIRWYGSSNGYYSEAVNFEEILPYGAH